MIDWKYGGVTFYGNTVNSYLGTLAIFIATTAVLYIITSLAESYFARRETSKTSWFGLIHDMVDVAGLPLYIAIAVYAAMQPLMIQAWIKQLISAGALITAVLYGGKAIVAVVDRFVHRVTEQRDTEASLIRVLGRLGKGLIWVIAFLFVLSNLGVEITTFVASLGVGGVAIAFALQNILGDVFASFSIYFDKPFEVGDFIIIGDDKGTVKHIGIKSTRIETLRGEELVVSNTELTSARVHNFKKMEQRRVEFNFGILYETSVDLVKEVPEMVRDVIGDVEKTELDRVHFKSFGDSALTFEVVYYVDAADYNEYMDVQEQINVGLMERFDDAGIEFAYPTRTIYMEGSEADVG